MSLFEMPLGLGLLWLALWMVLVGAMFTGRNAVCWLGVAAFIAGIIAERTTL